MKILNNKKYIFLFLLLCISCSKNPLSSLGYEATESGVKFPDGFFAKVKPSDAVAIDVTTGSPNYYSYSFSNINATSQKVLGYIFINEDITLTYGTPLQTEIIDFPGNGKYAFPQNVWIMLGNSSYKQKIYYTLDGSEPSESSNLFSESKPISIEKSLTLKYFSTFKSEYWDYARSLSTYTAESVYEINGFQINNSFTLDKQVIDITHDNQNLWILYLENDYITLKLGKVNESGNILESFESDIFYPSENISIAWQNNGFLVSYNPSQMNSTHLIYRIDKSGVTQDTLTIQGELAGPMAADSQYIWTLGIEGTSLNKFDKNGQLIKSIPVVLPSTFYGYRVDIAIINSNIWVLYNNYLKIISQDGVVIEEMNFNTPSLYENWHLAFGNSVGWIHGETNYNQESISSFLIP